MIKKIKNLKIKSTEQTEALNISELLGLKNKLLEITNGYQINDSHLTNNSLNEFKKWRFKVRKTNILTNNKNEELNKLKILRDTKPTVEYVYDEINTYKEYLLETLYKNSELMIIKFYKNHGNKYIVDKKIQQSIDYKSKKYPPNYFYRFYLILDESNKKKMLIEQVVDFYIKLLGELVEFEKELNVMYHEFLEKINSCQTIEDCEKIEMQILDSCGH